MTSSTVTLRPPTLEECQRVREWRNATDVLPMLRTGYKTADEQAAFYRDVICNPASNHRYYAIVAPLCTCGQLAADCRCTGVFLGLGGLTYLDRTPGEGEISLIIGPEFRGRGYGTAAVDALLAKAFGPLQLRSVMGECYFRSPAILFWESLIARDDCPYWYENVEAGDDASVCWRWGKR